MTGNEPAFPGPNDGNCPGDPGLTKREYFAAQAMIGLLSSETEEFRATTAEGYKERIQWFAEESVEMADATIAELAKPKPVV